MSYFITIGEGSSTSFTGIASAIPVNQGNYSPLWRFLVTEIDGSAITLLDHLATARTVTPKLNEPLEVVCTVPSDSVEVNRNYTDDFPQVAEGVRLLYCFRREGTPGGDPPLWVIRASTLILQTDDAAQGEDARTRITAWDPWQFLFYQPLAIATEGGPIFDTDRKGAVYNDIPANQLILELIEDAALLDTDGGSPVNNLFIDYGQTAFYTGTIETCADLLYFRIEPGANVGQVLQDICAQGYCDIWMEPIYDPVNRPGILCQLSIFAQVTDTVGGETGGMGIYNYAAPFTWDKAGQTLMGADNLYDGTARANVVQYWRSQGGKAVVQYENAASRALYGSYWAQQFFPGQDIVDEPAEVAARMQLALRKNGKETLSVTPSPQRSPDPFVDYGLGDRVPIYISNQMRQPLPPESDQSLVWQRVYGIPVDIDDNGSETIRQLIVGPIGAPPVTAPYKRLNEPDYAANQLRRLRTIEASPRQRDAEPFDVFALTQEHIDDGGIAAREFVTSSTVLGDQPDNYTISTISYVTGNWIANNWFVIGAGTLFDSYVAGSGAQYLLPLPALDNTLADGGTQSRYRVGFGVPQFGFANSYDISTTTPSVTMILRVSPIDYLGDGSPYMEAYDPVTDTLWGPSFPFTWADNDILLQGWFSYPLSSSLLDSTAPPAYP